MSALYHVSLFMDGNWLLVMPVKTAVGLQPKCAENSDSTRNEQVVTSVYSISMTAVLLA